MDGHKQYRHVSVCTRVGKEQVFRFPECETKTHENQRGHCYFLEETAHVQPSTPYTRWNTQKAVDKQTNYGSESKDGKRLPTTVLKFNRIERPQHATQKPVDLLEWLIQTYTNKGGDRA